MNLKGMLLNIPPFFIHTQRTERCVKLVTEAARSVIGEEKRNSMKPSQVQNRQKMPSFKSIKYFGTSLESKNKCLQT